MLFECSQLRVINNQKVYGVLLPWILRKHLNYLYQKASEQIKDIAHTCNLS